jgi:DNA-binding beta-propeller fold protein YncE
VCAQLTLHKQEIKQRMSKRWAWLAGLVVLILVAFLIACGNTYNSASDGLIIVTSQGSGLLETFSFSLLAGNNIPILNSPLNTQLQTCQLNGVPSSLVLDPKGNYAYTIVKPANCPNGQTGIQVFQVLTNGNLNPVGSLVADPNPTSLTMDSAGKFLFVAEGTNSYAGAPNATAATACPGTTAEYGVCAYAIGSGGALTPAASTFNFVLPTGFQTPNFAGVAPTPTVLPPLQNGVQTAVCSNPNNNALTTEYLYATDSSNGVIYEFGVNTSTGALTNPPNQTSIPWFPTTGVTGSVLTVPSGIVVEPCNRFVYVTNLLGNTVSGFSMCNGMATHSSQCPAELNGALFPVAGSPFSLTGVANGPGPLVSDPFGNFLYVLNTLSNSVSPFQIGTVSGSLKAGTVATTGLQPTSIAIRGDDNWLFVANFNSGTMSQYSVAPATGALSGFPAITTDNYPYGVAVK